MFRFLLLPLIGVTMLGGDSASAQQFPYVAYVAKADAYVRSGPGQKYYPTQRLPQGFAVEVYRHDGDRWCAIRPPEGSFSWVPSHQVRGVDQSLAEVVADGTVTRIGSVLSATRSTVQVLLPRGERVEVLAAQATDDSGWLRVVAPAGEFRWIAAEHLSRQPPLEAAVPPASPALAWTQSNQQPVPRAASEQPTDTYGHLQKPDAGPTNYDPQRLDVVAGSPAEMQLAQFQSQSNAVSPAALLAPSAALSGATQNAMTVSPSPPRVRFRGSSTSAGTATERVDELQLRLSQTVVRPPQEWNFQQLQAEASGLLEKTEAPQVRSELRDLLDRIARFQQVRQRYENVTAVSGSELDTQLPAETEAEAKGLTGMSSKVRQRAAVDLAFSTAEAGSPAADKPLYDAVGVLKPVASKRAKAPKYALVDRKGEVVSFITPTPDLNLRPYLGRHIGVHGKRGFMPEYRRAHVTAERVSPVDGRVRR